MELLRIPTSRALWGGTHAKVAWMRDEAEFTPPEPSPQPDLSVYCPTCGTQMKDNRCKLKCPTCGFFLSCSDFY
jgi:hypothetical protein